MSMITPVLFVAAVLAKVFVPLGGMFWAAAAVREVHVKRQRALLDQCRSLFILGVQALSHGAPEDATSALRDIRGLERRWRIGQWWIVRLPVIAIALVIGAAAFVVLSAITLFLVGLSLEPHRAAEFLRNMRDSVFGADHFLLFYWLGLAAIASLAVLMDWPHHTEIDDCGDRLERFIMSPRGVTVADVKGPRGPYMRGLDGLTAYEILGVGRRFTMFELRAARRRLASQYHPDRWHGASAAMRKAAEDAMKRINGAFDELRAAA